MPFVHKPFSCSLVMLFTESDSDDAMYDLQGILSCRNESTWVIWNQVFACTRLTIMASHCLYIFYTDFQD